MFTFLDPIEPLDVAWSEWTELAATRPRFVAQCSGPEVNGHADVLRRVGAVFVTDARTVCGLRLWDDAAEGVDSDIPWAGFEVEKITRMMLHQSGLAFEILASARVWSQEFDGRRLVEAAATSAILDYYTDVAAPLAQGRLLDEKWRWRSLLTGLLLARHGEVSFRLDTLLDRLDEVPEPSAQAAADYLAEIAATDPPLPERVSNYDWLDEQVATLRLQA